MVKVDKAHLVIRSKTKNLMEVRKNMIKNKNLMEVDIQFLFQFSKILLLGLC